MIPQGKSNWKTVALFFDYQRVIYLAKYVPGKSIAKFQETKAIFNNT